VTIETLPDVALLDVFNLYVDEEKKIEVWRTLVHVCETLFLGRHIALNCDFTIQPAHQ
jgi:hypothetical protein